MKNLTCPTPLRSMSEPAFSHGDVSGTLKCCIAETSKPNARNNPALLFISDRCTVLATSGYGFK